MRTVFVILMFTASAGTVSAQPAIPVLNWEKRSDWVSVKSDVVPPATGDGMADDTAAIQKALDGVDSGSTVYLPAGTYRITNTLVLKSPGRGGVLTGVLIVGHGRDTRLVWDGKPGGSMFSESCLSHGRLVGMVFDGCSKAAVGLYHDRQYFGTEVDHEHLAFLNFTDAAVFVDPKAPYALAETVFANCLFDNCRRGVVFPAFNDYDYTLDGCEFRRCETGIVCIHGNAYVRNCHFEASRLADMEIHAEHGSSVRRCTSVGSKTFLVCLNSVAPVTVQDCHIEAWTDPDGAIKLGGEPAMLFDCVFANPPDKTPPVKLSGGRLIASGNVCAGGGEVFSRGGARVYEVPSGQRTGAVTSARQRFLRDRAAIAGTVFDAKRDFGAKGNGTADDTAAIQRTIDAARTRGKGAIAYLPTGTYIVSDTLRIAGADYRVGGSGFRTCLRWKGPTEGTMVAVHDPQGITLEHIGIGNHDSGPMNNGVDVLQTSSGKPSSIVYDGVFVYGMYQKQPFRKGLWLRELSHESVVVLRHLQGNLHLVDSARATVLAGVSYEGSIVVEGKDPRRDGFLGILTRLATITSHALYLKDSHSVVASDFYVEQADNGYRLEGSADDPPGRATIQSPKLDFTVPAKKETGRENVAFDIHGYHGQAFFGPIQFYPYTHPVAPFLVRHEGRQPLDFFLSASCFYNATLDVRKEDGLHVFLTGNTRVGELPSPGQFHAEDCLAPGTLAALSAALDDLRALGELDLRLNHSLAPPAKR
jgi:hypothetical protein